jgi:CBS domain-containing protein
MRVKDVMTPHAECVGPDDTLQEAARKMRDLDVGPLPVCDHDRVVGIVTDRDITVRATAEGLDPKTATVRAAMTEGIDYCFEADDVAEAERLMAERQVRRLPVMNDQKRLVGIVSLGDLAIKDEYPTRPGEVLREVSEPAMAH